MNVREIMKRLKPIKRTVTQDGRDFYIYENGKFQFAISAPIRVRDYDITAALKARSWFENKMRQDKVPFEFSTPF